MHPSPSHEPTVATSEVATRVGLLLFDDFDLLDLGGPYEVFLTANRLAVRAGRRAPFAVSTHSLDRQPRSAYGGLVVTPGADVTTDHDLDVLVVPGAVDLTAPLGDRRLIDLIRQTGSNGCVVASVCTPDADWVDTGPVVTAGGLSKGLAMALHLVERWTDRDLAERTAEQLAYPWDSNGGTVAAAAPTAPPEVQADTKDWTWVLDRACGECGGDVSGLDLAELSELHRSTLASWLGVLDASSPDLAVRPAPDVWSTLEYSAHVSAVYRHAFERLTLICELDEPVFADVDPNVEASAERYDRWTPALATRELSAAGARLAELLSVLGPADLERPGLRSNGSHFTGLTLIRYSLHDPFHHLWDVGAI